MDTMDNWVEDISKMVHAYNQTDHKATGLPPVQVHFNLSDQEFHTNFLKLPTWSQIETKSIIGHQLKNRIQQPIKHNMAALELQIILKTWKMFSTQEIE